MNEQRRYEIMKYFLKGVAVTVGVLIVSMAVHVFCNMKGIELNTVVTSTVSGSWCYVDLSWIG